MSDTVSVKWKSKAKLWVMRLFELLLLLPFFLVIDAYLVPGTMRGWWLMGAALLSLLSVFLGPYLRLIWSRAIMGLFLAGSFAWAVTGLQWGTVVLLAVGFLITLQGFATEGRRPRSSIYWIGISSYFLGAFLFRLRPELEDTLPLLTWSGVFCLILVIFIVNTQHVAKAALSKSKSQGVPAALLAHNRMYIAVVLLAAISLTLTAGSLMGSLLWSLLRSVLGWLSGGASKEEQSQPKLQEPNQPQGLPLPKGEPGLLSLLLDIVFYTLAGAALAAGAVYVLYWLYKNGGGVVHRVVGRWLAFLRRSIRSEDSAGYVDEESSVFTWEAVSRRLREAWSSRFVPTTGEKWEDQTSNEERVRFLYREWIRRKRSQGYQVKEHLTPRETRDDWLSWESAAGRKPDSDSELDSRLLPLYYKVRYAGKKAASEEVDRVRQGKGRS